MRLAIHYLVTQQPWLAFLLCALLGSVSPLSFAPYGHWWIALISVGLFASVLHHGDSGKRFLSLTFAFALGYFGTGVSWVYVSIYYFGSAPLPLAVIMTAAFVAFVAFFFALPFYALKWIRPSARLAIGIPLLWVFSEWIRTWIFTGFPWLFVGYTHTETPLAAWAPIGGVLLVSLWSLLSSCLVAAFFHRQLSLRQALFSCIFLTFLWVGEWGLKQIPWTKPSGKEVSVGIVQPNIPQHLRWTPDYQTIIPERLHSLSEPLWHNDWIIWPEGAIHNVYHSSLEFIAETEYLAQKHHTAVISGVIYDSIVKEGERPRYYNSMITIGNSDGIYHKQRLVPFGEYVPFEDWIRGLIEFFDLPFSVISSGEKNQQNLSVGSYQLANAICYEIAYPTLVATQAANADVLLTVSNDAWFGESIGPLQHFQMAQMRAMEIGRYIIRGTNNGLSAIIKPDGKVQVQAKQYIDTNLEGKVIPMTGTTPFMFWKNYFVLGLLFLLASISFRKKRKSFLN